jgi:hypothetical protein
MGQKIRCDATTFEGWRAQGLAKVGRRSVLALQIALRSIQGARCQGDNLYAVADEEEHLGPLGRAVSLRVLNPGKDRYFSFFSFFAATHFLTQARMPGTLPAHLASQAASDPCFAWGPDIAGVSDASTTIPQTIKARMCFLSNLKRYLSRLRPSNQCPRLPAASTNSRWRVAMAAFGESYRGSGTWFGVFF